MSPLPFEVLTNGHCQGPKHLVVGDALLRRFGLAYDPEPLLEYISYNNEEKFATSKTKQSRLGLERVAAEVSLDELMWMGRLIALAASDARSTQGDVDGLLRFTSTIDVLHASHIGTLFPVMAARTTVCLNKAEAEIERIRRLTSDPDEIAELITAYVREIGNDASWLSKHENLSRRKIDLEEFASIVDSKSFEMHFDNLTIWNYPTTPPNKGVDDRTFSSQVVYSLGNGNVFGPIVDEYLLLQVISPQPLNRSRGEVIMFAEDFMDLRSGDALLDLISNNKDLTKLHLIVGDESVEGVEKEVSKSDTLSKNLELGRIVDYVGWPGRQALVNTDRHLVPVSG